MSSQTCQIVCVQTAAPNRLIRECIRGYDWYRGKLGQKCVWMGLKNAMQYFAITLYALKSNFVLFDYLICLLEWEPFYIPFLSHFCSFSLFLSHTHVSYVFIGAHVQIHSSYLWYLNLQCINITLFVSYQLLQSVVPAGP